eukprot:15347826-Ditylum_brightwellii.AAC.1
MEEALEHFFSWNTPFHYADASTEGEKDNQIGEEEEEEAMWIMGYILLVLETTIYLWMIL